MNEQIEEQNERKPFKPFDPIGTLFRHWLKIAVFGSILFVLFSPIAVIKKEVFYKTDGSLLVTPIVQTLIESTEDNALPSYRDYVQTLCERIKSPEVIEQALENLDPEYRKIFVPNQQFITKAAVALGKRLTIENVYGTYFISISLEAGRSKGLSEFINQLMDVYIEKAISETEGQEYRRLQYLQDEKNKIETQISNLTDQYKAIAGAIGTVEFREAGNIYNNILESLQLEHVKAYTDRIKKENQLKAAIREAKAYQSIPIDADVEDFVLKSSVASQMDIQIYRKVQTLKESLEGLAENNPDRGIIEGQIENLTESLDYSKNMLKKQTRQILEGKRSAESKEKMLLAQTEYEASLAAEQELKEKIDSVMKDKVSVSNKILDGQQIAKEIENQQTLLERVTERINVLRVEAHAPGRISIATKALPPLGPAGSTFKKLILMCFVLAFGIVVFICVLFDITDKRIRSKKDILNAIGAKVSWPISNYLLTRTENIPFSTATRDDSSNVVSKAIHSLAIRLDQERRENNAKLAIFTGVDARSGTSEILVNVAYAMTRLCKRVLVVDANLINPSFDRILLDNSGAMGLVEHMREEVDFSESIISSPERQYDVLPAGQLLLMSEINLVDRSKFPPMFELLKKDYDFILVDTPPVLVSDFTEFLLLNSDIVSLVVQGDRSKYDSLFLVGDILNRLQVKAVAVVLNWGAPRERNMAQILISRMLAPITAKLTTSPLWNPRHIFGTQSQGDHQGKRILNVVFTILRRLTYIVKNKKILLCIIGGIFVMGWLLSGRTESNLVSPEKVNDNSRFSIPIENSIGERDTAHGVKNRMLIHIGETKKDSVRGKQAKGLRDAVEEEKGTPAMISQVPEYTDNKKTTENVLKVYSLDLDGSNNNLEKRPSEMEINDIEIENTIKNPTDTIHDHFSEENILSLPSSAYTIQLMGADDRSYLINATKLFNISDETICFKKKNGSDDWYVLIYQLFFDRSEAMACVDALSPEIKANHPWVRKIGDIQKEIASN